MMGKTTVLDKLFLIVVEAIDFLKYELCMAVMSVKQQNTAVWKLD